MSEAHQRFQEWLTAGADGEPPRDLAVHASVCAECRRSIAAFDALAGVNPGRAGMPATATVQQRAVSSVVRGGGSVGSGGSGGSGGFRRRGRLAASAAGVLFSAVILGVGATQLISVFRGGGGVAQASPTPSPSVVAESNTPQPSESFTLPETASPSPTSVPTPIPTPIPTPQPTPPPKPGSPGAPTGLTAVASGNGSITLHWSAPASNGGSPITRYDVYRDGSNTKLYSTTTVNLVEFVGYGETHAYRITAVNKVGSGPYSNVAQATTPNVPGAFTLTVTTSSTPQQLDLSWSTPANNGSTITGYDIYYLSSPSTPIHHAAFGTNSWSDSGLNDGTSYSYFVKATNGIGTTNSNTDSASTIAPTPTPSPTPTPQCSDGIDNDGDGYTDYPNDPGCSSASGNSELPVDLHQCNDGIDNDGDHLIDFPEDPACGSPTDNAESPQNIYECNDGIDNELVPDGLIDFGLDPDCSSWSDNDESS